MKKFLLSLLIALCSLCGIFAFSACLDADPTHTHEYEAEYFNSTCTQSGYTEYECACGDRYTEIDEKAPPLGHSTVNHNGIEATCTADGYKAYVTCSRCDYTTYEAILALGHDISEYPGREAACTRPGWEPFEICTRCTYTTYKAIPALGHNTVKHSGVAATCSADGYGDYETCTRCDYSTYEVIPALGHNTVKHSGVAATCSADGYRDYETCTRCDYSTYEVIPALGHQSFEWKQGRACCEYTCTDCGFVQETALHNFEDGKCVLCGFTYNAFLNKFNSTYGFEYFGTLEKGQSLQKLYSDIDCEVRAFHENGETLSEDVCFAQLNYTKYGLSTEEAVSVWKIYCCDNPLYYWLSNTLVYTVEDIMLNVYEDYADGKVRTQANKKIYSEASKLCDVVKNETSAYLKVLAFHDAIIQSIDYAYDETGAAQTASWAHGILGVFEGKGAVCEGYAKAFRLLLNLCGVENIYVTGVSKTESHAWNLVKLDDGGWYWCDVTWDDTPNMYWGTSYTYFCNTDADFLKTHTLDIESSSGINFLYALPARSQTEYPDDEAGFKQTFTVDGLEYTVIGYNSVSLSKIQKSGAVEIPETVSYGGRRYTVIAIGRYDRYDEFSWCNIGDDTTSIFIPSTVRFIAYNTFYGADGLTEINVDGENKFYSSLDGVLFTKSLDILLSFPNAHKSTSYAIPEQTTKIEYHAFGTRVYGDRHLESLIVHSGVRMVGVVNFGWGYGNIINIIEGAWNDIVNSLTGKRELIIDENNPYFKVKDGIIFNSSYSCLYATIPGTETVTIPDTVTRMERDAFRENYWIKSISLPEGWQTIQGHQFTYCYALESINMPDSVTVIGNSAFFGCTNLKSVTIPANVTKIGEYAFYNCGFLSIVIPDGVTEIGKEAFGDCKNLVSVTLGSALASIGEDAFKGCNKLIEVINLSSLEITAGSTENGYVGFYAKNIYSGTQGASLITKTDDGFVFFVGNDNVWLIGYTGTLSELELPESFNGKAYDIYTNAFYESNIQSIVIPACVNVIYDYAFYGSDVVSLVIRDGVTQIGTAAFMRCTNLKSVNIPSSVEAIEGYAFCDCGKVNVYFAGSQREWSGILKSGAFWETDAVIIR